MCDRAMMMPPGSIAPMAQSACAFSFPGRRDQVRSGVCPQQGQHPLRLVLAVTLHLKQALQEPTARLAQFGEPFLQLRLPPSRVLDGLVLLLHDLLSPDRARQ